MATILGGHGRIARGSADRGLEARRWVAKGVARLNVDVLVTVLAGIMLVVAAVGTIYPVLPGSPIAIVTLLLWAWAMGSSWAWTAAIVGAVLCVVGWSASAVLTGRTLKQLEVPRWSILVAIVGGVIGMFLIPVVGIFVGFAVGLLVSEGIRHGEARTAFRSSIQTLKAMGIGVLIEFFLVCVAASVWMLGVFAHFAAT
jgi:uncharacterized protein